MKEGADAENSAKAASQNKNSSAKQADSSQFQQPDFLQQPQQGQADPWNWSNWYGYPVGDWTSVPPPPMDQGAGGGGMEWQEVVSGKPSTIQQQVALTNQQLMAHPTVADGVAGYGAIIPQTSEHMNSVGVGCDAAGGANVDAIPQPQTFQEAVSMPPPPPPLAQAQPGSIFSEETKKDKDGNDEANDDGDDDDDDDDGKFT